MKTMSIKFNKKHCSISTESPLDDVIRIVISNRGDVPIYLDMDLGIREEFYMLDNISSSIQSKIKDYIFKKVAKLGYSQEQIAQLQKWHTQLTLQSQEIDFGFGCYIVREIKLDRFMTDMIVKLPKNYDEVLEYWQDRYKRWSDNWALDSKHGW